MNTQTPIIVLDADMLRQIVREEMKTIHERMDVLAPPPDWLTIEEACQRLEVGKSTVYRMINEGRIEAKGVGKSRRVRLP